MRGGHLANAWLAPLFVIVLAALAGLIISRWYSVPQGASAQLVTEQRLMCPQCTSTRLDVCDRPICLDMKADIASRLRAGESSDSIVAGYRSAYGERVVPGSTADRFGVLAPGLLVAAGLLALGIAFRRRAGIARPAGSAGTEGAPGSAPR